MRYGEQALAIARQIRYPQVEGLALANLGDAYLGLWQPAAAQDHYQLALAVWQRARDHHGESAAHRRLGDLLQDNGSIAQARKRWHQALAILEDLGDTQAAMTHRCLAANWPAA